jgi:hypothetical protein
MLQTRKSVLSNGSSCNMFYPQSLMPSNMRHSSLCISDNPKSVFTNDYAYEIPNNMTNYFDNRQYIN